MTQLPNIITVARIAGSFSLLSCNVTGAAFWIIYGLCGISDVADGGLARRLKCVTKTGATLDSLADICFVTCCAWKLLPILELPQWLWMWAGVIVAIKIVNQLSALVMYGRCCFPHTLANKATGFLLFITVPLTFLSIIPIAFVAVVATLTAIYEGHFIRTSNNMRKILSLVFALAVTLSWAQNPINDSTRPPSPSISYGACIMRDDSVWGINENERFAMHSVMKFPQALYIVNYLSRKGLDLDDTIIIDKADLMQDTWSPMLNQFQGEKAFSYAELLELSLGQSDNNACELLFKYCGKPKAVENYMRKLGFHDIHIRITEKQMHENPAKAIENNITPTAMAHLLEWFFQHKDENQYLSFIWQTMANCSTGLKRIPTAIPADARIIHKTGTGFPSTYGAQDMNDAGIIIMPDGSHVIIAIFTTNSTSEAEIANIARDLLEKFELR